MNNSRIALFPLNANIFPGGRIKLRIFESRYLRMVKEFAGKTPAFAMAMFASKGDHSLASVLPVATLVNIIDFDQSKDGLLILTIEGTELISIFNISSDADDLRHADYQPLNFWLDAPETDIQRLKSTFLGVLSENPDIEALYPDTHDKPPHWFVLRWLELIPISPEKKISLLKQESITPSIRFLQNLIDQTDPFESI